MTPFARTDRRLATRALIASVALLVVLTALVAAPWQPLQRLDSNVATTLNGYIAGHDTEASFWRAVSAVCDPVVLRIVLLLAAVSYAWRRRSAEALLCVLVAIGSLVLSSALKAAVARPRPDVAHVVAHAAGCSFPSGHALTSAAFAITFGVVVAPRWRRVVVVAGVVLVAAVGFSRLVLGVHYVSDVVGGWCAAVALVTAARLGSQVAFMRTR